MGSESPCFAYRLDTALQSPWLPIQLHRWRWICKSTSPPRASILISLYIDNNIMILIHFLIYHMVMADMRAHTNARTRTHTVFRHTLTGFVAALILCPPVTERFIPNDRRRSLPTSSCNPFVSLTQSTELPKKCICHGWCCVRPGSCLQLHVRGGGLRCHFFSQDLMQATHNSKLQQWRGT